MNDLLAAAEGAIALICGGFIFLLFGNALPGIGLLDFTFWGIIYILVGAVLIIALVAAVTGAIISEVV